MAEDVKMGGTWNRKRLLASLDARELKAARNLTKLMKLHPSSILQILAASGLIDSSAWARRTVTVVALAVGNVTSCTGGCNAILGHSR